MEGLRESTVPKKEIAAHFGVSTSTIDTWVKRGMPFEQWGGRRQYDVPACERWHRDRTVERAFRNKLAYAAKLPPSTVQQVIDDLAAAVVAQARKELSQEAVEHATALLRPVVARLALEVVDTVASAATDALEKLAAESGPATRERPGPGAA